MIEIIRIILQLFKSKQDADKREEFNEKISSIHDDPDGTAVKHFGVRKSDPSVPRKQTAVERAANKLRGAGSDAN